MTSGGPQTPTRLFQLWCVRLWLWVQNAGLTMAEGLLFRGQRRAPSPKSVLIYRTGRLGDFLNAVPAIAALRARLPQARIALLTTASTDRSAEKAALAYGGGAQALPWLRLVSPSLVDDCHVFSLSGGLRKMIGPARRFIQELNPEIAFLLPFSPEKFGSRLKKLALFRLIGVRCRVHGIRVRSTLGLFARAQFEAGFYQHQAEAPMKALQEWPSMEWPRMEWPGMVSGAEAVRFPLRVDRAARDWAAELWSREGLEKELVIGIFPGAAFPHKRWPIDKYVRLCGMIHSACRPRLLLLGLASDAALTAEIARAVGRRCVDLAGATSVDQLAAVLERVSLFIGNDSGPAHLASAVGCPCITIMSAIEFPGSWEPWGSRAAAVRHDTSCSPCFSFADCPLGTRACTTGITVVEVFEKVRDAIGKLELARRATPC